MANIKEAKQFVKDRVGHGDEKQDTQPSWKMELKAEIKMLRKELESNYVS